MVTFCTPALERIYIFYENTDDVIYMYFFILKLLLP